MVARPGGLAGRLRRAPVGVDRLAALPLPPSPQWIGDQPMTTPTTAASGGKAKNDSAKFAGSFAPTFTVNVSKTTTNGAAVPAQGGGRAHPESALPAPDFTSPADVRNYC